MLRIIYQMSVSISRPKHNYSMQSEQIYSYTQNCDLSYMFPYLFPAAVLSLGNWFKLFYFPTQFTNKRIQIAHLFARPSVYNCSRNNGVGSGLTAVRCASVGAERSTLRTRFDLALSSLENVDDAHSLIKIQLINKDIWLWPVVEHCNFSMREYCKPNWGCLSVGLSNEA